MKTILAPLALAALLPAGAALADDLTCGTRGTAMQPWSAVLDLAQAQGWTIAAMEVDDGCYELEIADPGFNRVELVLDPASLEVLRVAPWGDPALQGIRPAAPAAYPPAGPST